MLWTTVENTNNPSLDMKNLFFGQFQEIFFICRIQGRSRCGIHNSFFRLGWLLKGLAFEEFDDLAIRVAEDGDSLMPMQPMKYLVGKRGIYG